MDDVKGVCSPMSTNEYTCYDDATLLKMRDEWNRRHPDDIILYTSPRKIWGHLRDRFSDVCSMEKCWLRKIFALGDSNIDTIESELFAPSRPKSWDTNPNEWLSSIDIEKVMSQYEAKYKNFVFLGALPIDFEGKLNGGMCVIDNMCTFDIKSYLARGKNKFGLIINTDPHTKGGEHWFSLYIDVSNNNAHITFFDSGGNPPPKKIKSFVKNITEQLKILDIPCDFTHNKLKHQYTTYQCGMYGIYFITKMLSGEMSKDDINKKRIPDSLMNEMRRRFFG